MPTISHMHNIEKEKVIITCHVSKVCLHVCFTLNACQTQIIAFNNSFKLTLLQDVLYSQRLKATSAT